MGKTKEIENALERFCGCCEKNEPVFYCSEYTNHYCPKKCRYAKQKEKKIK